MVSQKKDVVSLQRLPSPIKLFYWPFLKRSSAPILEMSLSFLPKLIAKLIWIRSQALERCSFTAGPSLGCRLRSPVCRVCPARGDGLCPTSPWFLHILCVYTCFIDRRPELRLQALQITSQLHVGSKLSFELSVLWGEGSWKTILGGYQKTVTRICVNLSMNSANISLLQNEHK